MNEFRCWIFAISDETGNSQFHSTGNSQCGFQAQKENFPSENQCTGNSQSLQSGAIILRQRVTIQSARGGGHSLIKVTGGGSDTDVFTWSGPRERSQQLKCVILHFDSPRANR